MSLPATPSTLLQFAESRASASDPATILEAMSALRFSFAESRAYLLYASDNELRLIITCSRVFQSARLRTAETKDKT